MVEPVFHMSKSYRHGIEFLIMTKLVLIFNSWLRLQDSKYSCYLAYRVAHESINGNALLGCIRRVETAVY
jgi:hypothetical protein